VSSRARSALFLVAAAVYGVATGYLLDADRLTAWIVVSCVFVVLWLAALRLAGRSREP
jgi:hypothetical protein